jgi:hypothetical protein
MKIHAEMEERPITLFFDSWSAHRTIAARETAVSPGITLYFISSGLLTNFNVVIGLCSEC